MHALVKRVFTMRQSSSRNPRSKGGFRLKHVLQICLLLAICTWLIYQVKHSHDKKKAYEDRIAKISADKATEKQTDLFNFGRKGLPENDSATATRAKDEDGEEEEVGDEEAKRDGDDAIDEVDPDRGDGENEQEEEFVGEDEKDGRAEEDALLDNEEREDSAQEAREENYKRDDASSAVAHDARAGEGEIEDSQLGNMAANGTSGGSEKGNAVLANVDFTVNASLSKGPDVEFTKSENGSFSTVISIEESDKRIELEHNATAATLPEKILEVTAAPTVNVSNNSAEYQSSFKAGERSGMTPAQDQTSLGNETLKEVPVEGNKTEIHPQNSTVNEN